MASGTQPTLTGELVVLEPLEERHREPLFAAASDPEIFRFFTADLSRRELYDHWGNGANTEAKYLMLDSAFEQLGMRRVEFKTEARNDRSRAALAALPAQFEGVHRNHMLVRGGESRDSAWYSMIDAEWPQVRDALRRRLTPDSI